jgi:hypothetical protein
MTYPDRFRSLLTISDHFWLFLTISDDFCFRLMSSTHCDPQFGDELHNSLFVYFRISAPFADDHVIVSHATYVTWPIPIASDHFQSLPIISDHFRWFLVISDDFYFRPMSSACCSSQFSTVQHPRSSVKQLLRTPVCRDIKSARPRQHTASARHRSSDSEILG